MQRHQIILGILAMDSAAILVSNLHLYSQIIELKTAKTSTELTPNDVILLIDERRELLETSKAKELLSSLEPKFQLAPKNTADNRRLYGYI